ncbi:unnamed protein product [Linum trigynum]|uniref:Uncharacterized protein n=1 Tax=Linum trigynum TaxID=586398 RepID=A0AAV2DWS6_9ROSI
MFLRLTQPIPNPGALSPLRCRDQLIIWKVKPLQELSPQGIGVIKQSPNLFSNKRKVEEMEVLESQSPFFFRFFQLPRIAPMDGLSPHGTRPEKPFQDRVHFVH